MLCDLALTVVSLVTTGYSLFKLSKNNTLTYKKQKQKKQQRQGLQKTIQTPHSYETWQ